jgi:hypothetical protein
VGGGRHRQPAGARVPGAQQLPALHIGGSPIYAPRLGGRLGLTALIAAVNYRGIKPSGIFQDVMTFGLLATFAIFTLLGFVKGTPSNMQPLFAPGKTTWLSIFLVLQIVPYFMTGFESVAKGSEEAKAGFDPRNFTKAIYAALIAGFLFYVLIIAVVTYVYPWQEIVSGHVRTEVAFERTFGSHQIAQLILFGAFLSLLKIFNGNFVAATRMLYAIGRRNLVHPSLGRVHAAHGTPVVAIVLMAVLTAAAAMFGDAILVPITEVGSLAVGVGWLSACVAYLLRRRGNARGLAPGRLVAGDGLARLRRQPRDHPDEDRPVGAGSFTRPSGSRSPRGRASGSLLAAATSTSLTKEETGESAKTAEKDCSAISRAPRLLLIVVQRLLDEVVLRDAAHDFDLIVDDGLGDAVDAVFAREVREFRRFHRIRGDVLVGEGHFMREADRPRTVRSSRC